MDAFKEDEYMPLIKQYDDYDAEDEETDDTAGNVETVKM